MTGLGNIPVVLDPAVVPEVKQALQPTEPTAEVAAALVDIERLRTLTAYYMPSFSTVRSQCFAALNRIEQTLRGTS